MAADKNAVDGLAFRSEVLDIGVARDGAAHCLPVGNDHGWSFNDRPCPTEFLRPANLDAAGVERDAAGLNLFNGHAAVFWFFAEFVGQLDEMDEVCVEEGDATASWVNDLLAAEVEAIPVEER